MRDVALVVALGDSLSSGSTDRDGDGRRLGWARRTAAMLEARQSTPMRFVGLATDHSTAEDVRARQLPEALEALASTPAGGRTYACVTVGLNDVRLGVSAAAFAAAYEDVIAGLSDAGATVLTLTMPDPLDSFGLPPAARAQASTALDRLNDHVRSVSMARSTVLLDACHAGEVQQAGFWAADGLHPSGAGHAAIAGAAVRSLVNRGLVEGALAHAPHPG